MKITKVELSYPKKHSFKFRGWAKITLDDQLIISGVKFFEIPVQEGSTEDPKRYIKFPERRPSLENTNGQSVSIPIIDTVSDEFKEELVKAIFTEYDARPKRVLQKRFNKTEE